MFGFVCFCFCVYACVFARCCIFFCTDKTHRMSRSREIGNYREIVTHYGPGRCDHMLTDLRREGRPEGEFNCFWRDLT